MIPLQSAVTTTGGYQHVVVVMSIVLGLAVTGLLKGAAQLYRTRARVRPYWLHGAWLALLVVFSLFLWWTYWSYRSIDEWTFPRFVLYLSPVVVFYFLTSLIIPDPTEAVTDLRKYYYDHRRGFFGSFAVYVVVAGATAIVVRDLPVSDSSNLFRLGTVGLMLMGARSDSEKVHVVLFTLATLFMLAFIVIFQFRLA